ncbi:MAG: hypothetical protein ACYDA2_09365 [Acidimicrobiales bacterium]
MRRTFAAVAVGATTLGTAALAGTILLDTPAMATTPPPAPIPVVCQSAPGSPLGTGGDWPGGILYQVCVNAPVSGYVTVADSNGGYVILQTPSSYVGLSLQDGGVVAGSGAYNTNGGNTTVIP